MKQCSRPVPEKAKKFSLVSQPSVDTLEANFKKVQSLVSTTCCYSMGKIKDLANYGFQLIGVSINGKSYIYINAFLKGDINLLPTWKTEPVIMCDGGEGFWGALFDPETKEFSQLSFNGRM